MATLTAAAAGAAQADWATLAERARVRRQWTLFLLYAFMIVTSLPVVIPYFWLLTMSFSGRSTGTDTFVLWRSLSIVAPALFVLWLLHWQIDSRAVLRRAQWAVVGVALVLLTVLVGPHLTFGNFAFLWNPNIVADLQGETGAGSGQFPSVWTAFFNSLFLASAQTAIVVVVATLAGYYLSRFGFSGRESFLKALLVLHAFPVMTLIIPLFLLMHWLGMLDTVTGVILIVCALELPFAIFIMKGFFDAVPWDIEMSAMTDGASRRQAFLQVILPQVRTGMLAIGVFAFLRGWEEYVFVRTMLFDKDNWTMSLYLFWVADDVHGVNYALVTAVAVFYLLPTIFLYTFTQKYLTQMSIGGIKG